MKKLVVKKHQTAIWQKMKNYTTQYKAIFVLSWIVMYLIFPAWRSSNLSYLPYTETIVVNLLIVYFAISAYFMNHCFKTFIVDKPAIIKINGWFEHIKNNASLVFICCLSLMLHADVFSLNIVLGEVVHLRHTFWIYDFIVKQWHEIFDFPVQYFFWLLIIVIIMLIKQKKLIESMSGYISAKYSFYGSNRLAELFLLLFIICFFNAYAHLFPDYSWHEATQVLRYPPVSRILNLLVCFAFGLSHTGPRILQLIFYLLCTIYLYRTIHLFHEKETALAGAVIYLFSPIIFSYASRASLASGTVFFIVLISFYFLRFLKYDDNRDLILTSFFTGMGFLYKRVLLFMLFICFAYLLISKFKKPDRISSIHFKILLLSLIPILPWFQIGITAGATKFAWHHLISFDGLTICASMIQSQISLIISFLFLFSFIYILLAKRDELSLFFGLLFITYYGLFTLMESGEFNHRYVMVLYPALAVFLTLLLRSIDKIIRWKYFPKIVLSVLTIYLIFISVVPRSSSNLITFKYKDIEGQYFPNDKSADWIMTETKASEKILGVYLRFDFRFYLERVYERKNQIKQGKFTFLHYANRDIVYPFYNLKAYCYKEKISYVMIPYSPKNSLPLSKFQKERREMERYLKDNMERSNDFIEVARFNLDDNFIVIYKLKGKN